uniref:Amino acid permease/ SLC12A domain-containing protein n=1 Tax=Arcella intermedia TaxID=1963864 RepID=A0A6B2L8P6_9EUKA
MWVCVAFFNPVVTLLGLSIIDMTTFVSNQRVILARMGEVSGGVWLQYVVSVDAFLVLSGAVLTGYVGITGLVHRMALDRLLPSFLLHKNSLRGTNHWIIIAFFLTTSSLFLIVNNNVNVLSGVYTVSFLSVMSLFALGNMLLKYKRSHLPREVKTKWVFVLLALGSVISALIGNIVLDPTVLKFFAIYFGATMVIVITMIGRVTILRFMLFFLSKIKSCSPFTERLKKTAQGIRNRELVFYTRQGDLHVLNKALMYVRENESSNRLTVVHAYEHESLIPPNLKANVKFLDHLYPKIRVDLLLVKSKFSPQLTDFVASVLQVPKNYMFMACPNTKFPHNIGDFGGVRLITH